MFDTMLSHTYRPPLPLPTPPTTSTSVAPIPTVIPGNDPIFQELHTAGKRTLWVVTVLMGISSLVFYSLSSRRLLSKRVFHTLVSLTTTISFIIYLALATGEGITWKHESIKLVNKHVPDTTQDYFRQVLWLRYVNWFLTEPLILTNLGLLSGLPGAHLLVAITADYVLLASGLLGTYAGLGAIRWIWFTIGAVGYLTLIYHLGINGSRAAANTRDDNTRRLFASLSGVTLLVKILYPIAIAAGALALKMNVDTEIIIFAILDIFTQGILGYWLLLSPEISPGSTVYIDGFWSTGLGGEGAIRISEENGA